MIDVNQMTATELAEYIQTLPTDSCCARAKIEKLEQLLVTKQAIEGLTNG
jgi:hypothetical protein